MKRFEKLLVVGFGFFLSLQSYAVPIELHIDHLDKRNEVADSDRWVGDLVCEWRKSDLYATFSTDSNPRKLVLKVPSLRSVLNNPKVDIDLAAETSEFSLTTDTSLRFSMVAGSKCTVLASNESDPTQVGLAIRCAGLKDQDRQFISKINIHSPGLSCPKPRL